MTSSDLYEQEILDEVDRLNLGARIRIESIRPSKTRVRPRVDQ